MIFFQYAGGREMETGYGFRFFLATDACLLSNNERCILSFLETALPAQPSPVCSDRTLICRSR